MLFIRIYCKNLIGIKNPLRSICRKTNQITPIEKRGRKLTIETSIFPHSRLFFNENYIAMQNLRG